jgi:uracil-DNA glycosylase
MINPNIESQWKNELFDSFQTISFSQLRTFLIDERSKYRIYPPGNQIFNAFEFTPFNEVKVVILGQDPYHGPGQAHGLCFSVPDGIKPPPSLVNIFKEIERDFNFPTPTSGNLEKWARQGVLLLNATLTVRANEAGSHQGKGWEEFTDSVIQTISSKLNGVVFMLWGNYAQAKEKLIDTSKHLVLKTVHPSPLSAHRGFIGCGHFSKTNQYLLSLDKEPIDWRL